MLVSVVIPLWNKVHYVERSLRSALGQSHDDLEIIVVNDGSSDGSFEVVKAIRDPRITIISQENSGPGVARNTGLFLAKGEYIAFIDADDEWHPNFIGKALTALEQDKSLTTIAVNWSTDDTWNADFAPWQNHGVVPGPYRMQPDCDVERMAWHISFMSSSSTLSRTKVLADLGGFCPYKGELFGEDRYLWISVLMNHNIFIDPDCYVKFDRNASALSTERTVKPPLAYLSHATDIARKCPDAYQALLKRFLTREFRLSVKNWAAQGRVIRSWRLYRSLVRSGSLGKYYGVKSLLTEIPRGFTKGAVDQVKNIIRPLLKRSS